jgi:hypothetical protein
VDETESKKREAEYVSNNSPLHAESVVLRTSLACIERLMREEVLAESNSEQSSKVGAEKSQPAVASESTGDHQARSSGSPPSSTLLENDGLLSSESLTETVSLSQTDRKAPRGDSLMDGVGLTDSESLTKQSDANNDLMTSLPRVNGHMKLSHQITDCLYARLDPYEQAVHLQLYRLSWGYGKQTCLIGLPRLAERAGMGTTAAAQAIKKLIKKDLVRKLGMRFGRSKEQGIEYWVRPPLSTTESDSLSPASRLTSGDAIKEKCVSKDTQTQRVGVDGSRFSLEECRRYAEHLRCTGQGITNPGGFARTIYRTGEADSLMNAFFNPEPPAGTLDVSRCPSCNGTGWEFMEGKGVRRCRHQGLQCSK